MEIAFLDDFFGYPERTYAAPKQTQMNGFMQADVAESEDAYTVEMNLPGKVKKENVKIELKDGYLIVNASTKSETTEEDKKTKYIRKERYSGSGSRTFYVGKDLTQKISRPSLRTVCLSSQFQRLRRNRKSQSQSI